jgi:hypothetical protein
MNGSLSAGRYPSGNTIVLGAAELRFAIFRVGAGALAARARLPLAAAAFAFGRPLGAGFFTDRLLRDFPMHFPNSFGPLLSPRPNMPGAIWCPYLGPCFFKSSHRYCIAAKWLCPQSRRRPLSEVVLSNQYILTVNSPLCGIVESAR